MVFPNEVPGCVNNDMVECPMNQRNCERCGWSPEVSAERLRIFAEKHPDLADELVRIGKLTKEQ